MSQIFNATVCQRRKDKDLMKLRMSDYQVTMNQNDNYDFFVLINGPKDSLYEGGVWNVHVVLPDQYPYKSPSIGFDNRIYHPNVDEASGSICLDVINQTWSPMFDLVNIFESFLPQLLLYPNPSDPLNPEGASLMIKDYQKYKEKVKSYVYKYASTQKDSQIQMEQTRKISNISTNIDETEQMDEEISQISDISSFSELSKTSEVFLCDDL